MKASRLLLLSVVLSSVLWHTTAPSRAASAWGPTAAPTARIPAGDPLNGGFLVVNMHGFLFHPLMSDLAEDVAYARWLGSGVIRIFATDNNGFRTWNGQRVGARIADAAPLLRAAGVQLIVALVNNHRAVPGEAPESAGWMDDYHQLLLPFYTTTWRGPYLSFAREVISEVQARQALDVIYAWELGNELHTPRHPPSIIPFINQMVDEIRLLDPLTPILPGTMGANHLEPGMPDSQIARWLYCEAPIDAYTLHAYDWVSRERPGDMPIDWDLDTITAEPCPNGRRLPVIVEELGTSRALPGVYGAQDERGRVTHELRQIDFVRRYPQVVGFGVWNGESPRLIDRTFVDTRRGLTSFGTNAQGGGSCYDPLPESIPGARCELERAVRQLAFARMDAIQWLPASNALGHEPPAAGLESMILGNIGGGLSVRGWLDSTLFEQDGLRDIAIVLGEPQSGGRLLASEVIRARVPADDHQPTEPAPASFSLDVPLVGLPSGANTLSVLLRTSARGTWYQTLQVVVPTLGAIPVYQPVALATPIRVVPVDEPPPRLEVRWPDSGSSVPPSFSVETTLGLATADSRRRADDYLLEVFLEPGRDRGGRLVGSVQTGPRSGELLRVPVTIPLGGHTLHVHARSLASGAERVIEIPVNVVR